VGNEYSAQRYNHEQGGHLSEDMAGNIKAAAAISNQAIKEGAILFRLFHAALRRKYQLSYHGYWPHEQQ